MARVIDELDGLRASLQEHIYSDFEHVVARSRRTRRRRTISAGAGMLLVATGIGFVIGTSRTDGVDRLRATQTAPSSTANAPGATTPTGSISANNGQTRLAITDPPCGTPTQQLLTLDGARAQLGDQLVLPTDPNANESNVDEVAVCPSETIITFATGVWVIFMPAPTVTPDWKKAVAADANESQLGSVHGSDAWVITPDQAIGRRGSVTFINGNAQVIVEGNSHLPADSLLQIAESLPRG